MKEFKPKLEFLQSITGDVTKEHVAYKYALGMTVGKTRHSVYYDYNLCIQKECHGNRCTYYIEADEREFKTEDELLVALNELLIPIRKELEKA